MRFHCGPHGACIEYKLCMIGMEIGTYLNYHALLFLHLAPSPLGSNHITFEPFPDTGLYITWRPPDAINGRLIHYKIVVHNPWTGYNFARTISPDRPREVDLTDLCKL